MRECRIRKSAFCTFRIRTAFKEPEHGGAAPGHTGGERALCAQAVCIACDFRHKPGDRRSQRVEYARRERLHIARTQRGSGAAGVAQRQRQGKAFKG